MIRTLRVFFLRRPLREKLLLVAFTVMGVVIWVSLFSDRAQRFWRQKTTTTSELHNQQIWLNNRAKVEAAAQKAARSLEPGKTFDGNQLYAKIQQLARDAGIRNPPSSVSPTPPQTNGQFSVHSLGFTVIVGSSEADWMALRKFYKSIQDNAPYIGIDQFTLGIRGTPAQHILQLRVSSVEIVR